MLDKLNKAMFIKTEGQFLRINFIDNGMIYCIDENTQLDYEINVDDINETDIQLFELVMMK